MHPKLERYAARAYSRLYGHWLIGEGRFEFVQPDDYTVVISGRAMAIDGSPLYLVARIEVEQDILSQSRYSYQFRNEDEPGFFRYDDASHGRPEPYHHKHAYGKPIEPTTRPPTLFEFLREVEEMLMREP
ncbi:MAG: hypothetical protein HY314_02190 [Acidobacteria bacterium]|nr:hypothetical protein [Acidobacteriota bacterium]